MISQCVSSYVNAIDICILGTEEHYWYTYIGFSLFFLVPSILGFNDLEPLTTRPKTIRQYLTFQEAGIPHVNGWNLEN